MSILPDPQQTSFRAHLCTFEGRVPWLYADINSNPTAGVGHECSTPESAVALGFSEAEWNAVKASPAGHAAAFYESLSAYRMSEQQMDAVLDADIAEKETELLQWVPDVMNFPPSARQALMDFAYDPGPERLAAPAPRGWPHMMAAIRAGDWTTASAQSTRNGIQAARNQYVAQLLLAAATDTSADAVPA